MNLYSNHEEYERLRMYGYTHEQAVQLCNPGRNAGYMLPTDSGQFFKTNGSGELQSKKQEPKKMSKKFYKVVKENFMWQVGAILEHTGSSAYRPLEENELWCVSDKAVGNDWVAERIVENSPDYFERVYPVNLITKTIYKVKAEAMEFINKDYTEPK